MANKVLQLLRNENVVNGLANRAAAISNLKTILEKRNDGEPALYRFSLEGAADKIYTIFGVNSNGVATIFADEVDVAALEAEIAKIIGEDGNEISLKTLKDAIDKLNSDENTDGSVANAVKAEADRAKGVEGTKSETSPVEATTLWGAVEENAKAIDVLNGADTVEGSVAKSIKDAVAGLDSTIAAVDGEFITSVTITDGKIASNSKGSLTSTNKTIDINKFDIDVNIDGTTIVKDEDGTLSVASSATAVSGKEAIVVGAAADGGKEVSLKIKEGETVLSQSADGLTSAIKLIKTEGTGTVKETYSLVGIDGKTALGDVITINKDQSFVGAELGKSTTGEDVLKLTYTDAEGNKQTVEIPLGDFLREAEFKNGLEVAENGEVSVKIASDSETFLTVGGTGVKLSGVQDAINKAAAASKTVVEKTDSGTHVTVTSTVANGEGEDGHVTYTIAEDDIASAKLLGTVTDTKDSATAFGYIAKEADRATTAENTIEASVGLAENGSHVATSGTYTKAATTVVGEIAALDAALKLVDDASVEAITVNGVDATVADNKATVTIDGADINLTDYAKATADEAVTADDTVNSAIGKLEYKADTNAAAIKNVADAAISVKAGNGISVSGENTEKTIAAVIKENDPVLEVTESGIATKENAVFDCGYYAI